MDKALALSAALIWALANLLYKKGVQSLPLLQTNLVRLFLPLILGGVLWAVLGTGSSLGALTWPVVGYIAAGTIVSLVIGDLFFFYSLREVGVQVTSVITSGYPVFSLAIGVLLLHERVSVLAVIGTILIVIGIAVISSTVKREASESELPRRSSTAFKLSSANLLGISAAIAAALSWAVGIAFFDVALRSVDSFFLAFLRTVVAVAALSSLVGLTRRSLPGPKQLARRHWPLLLAGLLSQGVAQLLLYLALSDGLSSIVAPLSSTAPLFVIVLATILRLEKASVGNVLGGIVTTTGIMLLIL